MEHVYAVQTARELEERQAFVRENQGRIDEYVRFLERKYAVKELPRAIVWTTRNIAARLVSDIPLPAYTNDFRVMFDPCLEDWREIYLAQLDGLTPSTALERVRDHYQHGLSQNHVLHILGHELAHHSELFPDGPEDYFSGNIWFEEGMVEYIGRRYFLTDAEFEAQAEADQLLVDLLEPQYGGRSLDQFGTETYQQDFAGIFFDYRRSFLAIRCLVDEHDGDALAVLRSCCRWYDSPRNQTLAQWFRLEP
ncbi:MAG: hypothetical protein NC489_35645 [Ruminococcus flavefaciens]|nr:hypothetical protein [Ruminococcus flavefaciens]